MKHSSSSAGKGALTRSSNLELYRILVMLMIIASHYVSNSGLKPIMLRNPQANSTLFLTVFGFGGKVGINCFTFITGYFMSKSELTARKYCKLLFEVLFYRFIFGSIFFISGYADFSLEALADTLFPIQ